jgi:hypothetical protein
MGGNKDPLQNSAHNMGLGTKNRQKQTADICKQHLREKYRDQRGLVEEFILEFEVRDAGSPERMGRIIADDGGVSQSALQEICSVKSSP